MRRWNVIGGSPSIRVSPHGRFVLYGDAVKKQMRVYHQAHIEALRFAKQNPERIDEALVESENYVRNYRLNEPPSANTAEGEDNE